MVLEVAPIPFVRLRKTTLAHGALPLGARQLQGRGVWAKRVQAHVRLSPSAA